MKLKTLTLSLFLAAFAFQACKTAKSTNENLNKNRMEDLGQVIIYKTIANFDNLVPVIMNDSKTEIISYPHPSDLLYAGEPARPVHLHDAYLLDLRGISENVVFTNYTYDEYIALPSPPSLEALKARIVEKHPLKELYRCGDQSKYREIKELNNLIKKGFPECEKADILSMQIKF